jgi:hypothetical protein
MRFLSLALVLAGSSLLGGLAVAQTYASPRQYYGGWNKYPGKVGYYYRPYYYKPTPRYTGYKHHYVVYNRAKPQHYYYYNTYTKKYWGRCPTKYDGGTPAYYQLAEADRHEDMEKIPEKAFNKKVPGGMPPIPESGKEGIQIDRPPDDPPPVETE